MKKIASYIIGNLTDRGFELSLDEMCSREGFDFELAEGVLDSIQRLDPPGICARNLKECLSIQLREASLKNGIIEKILDLYYEDVI